MTAPALLATLVLVGCGSLGFPLAESLLGLGLRSFVLVDPKRLASRHIVIQCEGDEVGLPKAIALARRLRSKGARAVARVGTVEELEPGWLPADGIVLACADRLGALRAAHDLAFALARPLVRLNIEPSLEVATLACFDYRASASDPCCLCAWGPEEFARQEAARSCVPAGERRTASPRALTAMASGLGALTAAAIARGEGPVPWGRVVSFSARGPSLVSSTVSANPACPSPHEARPPLARLGLRPAEASLEELAARFGARPADLVVSASGAFTQRSRCAGCGQSAPALRWARGGRPAGRCACGSRLWPVPFFTRKALRWEELRAVATRPLASLGVPRRAALTFSGGGRAASFVLD